MALDARDKVQMVRLPPCPATPYLDDGSTVRSRQPDGVQVDAIQQRSTLQLQACERGPSDRWALASLSLSMLLASLGTSIANVALPTLAEASPPRSSRSSGSCSPTFSRSPSLVVSVGRLGDIAGRRRLLMAGILLFTVASVLVRRRADALAADRRPGGAGHRRGRHAGARPWRLVGDTVPKARIGSAMGLLGTMSAVGTALGPSLGGVLIAGFGWRAIFLVNVPLGVLALVLARRNLPADRPTSKAGRRRLRSRWARCCWPLTLAAYALAMTSVRGSFGLLNVALLAVAALGVGLFVLRRDAAASPLIRLAIFRDPALSASLATSALVSTVMMATLVVGPFYLARALGLDAALVGLVMSDGPAGRRAERRARWAHASDRFGARRIDRRGLVGIAVGCLALSLAADLARHRRLRRSHRRRHRRLCAVPDGQQHRRHDRCPPGPARRRLRHAQPVAKPRPGHGRVRNGCRLRTRVACERRRGGAARGDCHRHAGDVRSRGSAW